MNLTVTGPIDAYPLAAEWADALRPMVIRHPDPRSTVELELTAGPVPRLAFRLDVGHDTTTGAEMRPLNVSEVNLTYFPGVEVAQAWVAAAWTGYLMHEALELVTVGAGGPRPIDPHGPDIRHDKCIRDGLPGALTADTLLTALCVVMKADAALQMVGR